MKTVFMGAVEGSAVALLSLCDDGLEPDMVVTLPLEKAGSHSDFADLGPIAQAPSSARPVKPLRLPAVVITGSMPTT